MGQVLFQGEIILEIQKWGGIILKYSLEPLSYNRSYLHKTISDII
jgi:hypothetical protein